MRSKLIAAAVLLLVLPLGCSRQEAAENADNAAQEAGEAAESVASVAASAGERAADTLEGEVFEIRNSKFVPDNLSSKVGEQVSWKNADTVLHALKTDTDVFGPEDLNPGETYSKRITAAGTYGFRCTIHSQMQGTLVVA